MIKKLLDMTDKKFDSKEDYLNSLSKDKIYSHTFTGFKMSLKMISGDSHTLTLYFRNYIKDSYILPLFKFKDTILTDDNAEIIPKYIESLNVLEELEPLILGPKAYKSIREWWVDEYIIVLNTAQPHELLTLMEKDN